MSRTAKAPTLASYTVGFVSSLSLTLLAYWMVVNHKLNGWQLIFTIVTLALVQCVIQLLFFLQLGNEPKPRWKLAVFGFMLLVIVVIVVGSLWIMDNLNYRMSPPNDINTYLRKQDGL